MNTFEPINFKPADEETAGGFDWINKGPPYDEIAFSITHYLRELDRVPHGKKAPRPHFERTQWWHEERETGKQIECDGEVDGETRMVTTVALYTHECIVAPNDGLLAVYEFPDLGRMRVIESRTRANTKD